MRSYKESKFSLDKITSPGRIVEKRNILETETVCNKLLVKSYAFLAMEYAHMPPKMLQSNKEGCKRYVQQTGNVQTVISPDTHRAVFLLHYMWTFED